MSDTTTGTTSPLSMEDAKTLKFIAELQGQIGELEDMLAAIKHTVVSTIGGVDYEGFPTSEINYLQRLRILVEKEKQLEQERAHSDRLAEAISLHIGVNGCMVSQRLHALLAEHAKLPRLTSEQQHCAKCGGVECHALAGMFCGEHSYEGCREWGGCPICENAKLKSALAASGRGEAKTTQCSHERLDEDGICRKCGAARRGI